MDTDSRPIMTYGESPITGGSHAPKEFPRLRVGARERQDAQDRRLISRAIPLRGSGSPCPSDKKARTMDPHRTGMEIHHACHLRPSDYHQPRPRPQGRSGLLAAAVAGDVPARAVPGRAPPRPDRGVRPSGRPSDPEPALPSPHREGRPGAGPAEPPRQSRRWYPRRGTRPFTFKTTFGEVTVQRSRISHKHDDTIEVPSARAWETSHQLHITRNLRDAVCDQFSDRSAGESRAEVCRNAGDEDLLGLSTIIDIVHQEASNWSTRNVSEAARSWTERPRPSWPCSAPLLPTPTP